MFVTALVGFYTIEDLWNKFGDLRMSAVCPFASSPMQHTLMGPTANPTPALGSPRRLSDHTPDPRLYVLLQNPFPDSQSLWAWRCADVLTIPGQP